MYFDLQLNHNPVFDLVKDTVFLRVCFRAIPLSKQTVES